MSKVADVFGDQLPLILLFFAFLVALAVTSVNHDFRDIAVAAFGAFSGAAGMRATNKQPGG